MTPEATPLSEMAFHKKMAVDLFNETWTLLDKTDRTPGDDARMSHLAHASRLHWGFVRTAENFAIGEWQVARVHAVLRQADAALFHAQRVLELAVQQGLGPFTWPLVMRPWRVLWRAPNRRRRGSICRSRGRPARASRTPKM